MNHLLALIRPTLVESVINARIRMWNAKKHLHQGRYTITRYRRKVFFSVVGIRSRGEPPGGITVNEKWESIDALQLQL